MELLGSLGIDIKLLIAQMLNFGLLLWLLTKFLYRPILQRIAADESKLKQVQRQSEELKRQKKAFAEEKRQELAAAQKQAQAIIKEAEKIAREIKQNLRAKTDKETAALIKQTKAKVSSLRPQIERAIAQDLQAKITTAFRTAFLAALPPAAHKELQNILWRELIKRIDKLSLRGLRDADWSQMLDKFELAAGGDRKKAGLEKELAAIVAQKIGPVVLEYAYPLTAAQKQALTALVSAKSGIELAVTFRHNKQLINGFRLEIAGMVIENNLLDIVKHATIIQE